VSPSGNVNHLLPAILSSKVHELAERILIEDIEHHVNNENSVKQSGGHTGQAAVVTASTASPAPTASRTIASAAAQNQNNWLKIQAHYNDKWQTAIPIENIKVLVDDTEVQQGISLNTVGEKSSKSNTIEQAQSSASEAGVVVIENLPDGKVIVEVERDTSIESQIASLRNSLQMQLDGAYRDTVKNMAVFQSNWDEYGYASIAIDGGSGFVDGADKWLDDQADLFEVETWSNLGSLIKEGAGIAFDTTADYAASTFESVVATANEHAEWLDENSDNLLLASWNWYEASMADVAENAERTYKNAVKSSEQYINDAASFLEDTAESLEKMYQHRNAIMELPTLIAKGDAGKVQDFVDNILVDIDPEMAKEIQDSPEFNVVLELINDHDSALTYIAYMELFLEAVPPNFYAYISGKGGMYIAIEVVLLIVVSFLTAGAGTAARLTMLVAKLTSGSAKVAGSAKKIKQAQAAISSFSKAVEDFSNSADTLNDLGKALTKARSSGIVLKGRSNKTLVQTKENAKRDTRCRLCHKSDHRTPRSLRGCVEYI